MMEDENVGTYLVIGGIEKYGRILLDYVLYCYWIILKIQGTVSPKSWRDFVMIRTIVTAWFPWV